MNPGLTALGQRGFKSTTGTRVLECNPPSIITERRKGLGNAPRSGIAGMKGIKRAVGVVGIKKMGSGLGQVLTEHDGDVDQEKSEVEEVEFARPYAGGRRVWKWFRLEGHACWAGDG
jgi:hypothetical protein